MPSNPFKHFFKEVQGDKSVYTKLQIGFACVFVLGVLAFFVGLAVSPDLRHDIGIGNGHALPGKVRQGTFTPNPSGATSHFPPTKNHPSQVQHNENREKQKERGGKPHRGNQHGNVHHGESRQEEESRPPITPEAVTAPPKAPVEVEHEHESPSSSKPAESSPPAPSHPTEGSGGTHKESKPGGGGSTTPPVKVEVTPPKIGVEVELPPITNNPTVEEVTGTVNETVNGVTSTVEETVNEIGLPIHVEVPEICLINCH